MKHSSIRTLVYLCIMLTVCACPCKDATDPDCPNYNPCPDPANPECDNYNPCYPYDCDSRVELIKVYSEGLESSLLPVDPERSVSVYLPAGYDTATFKSYPVIYILHGFTCDYDTWYGGTNWYLYDDNSFNLKTMLDTLIGNGDIEPMMVVSPSNLNSYEGSWYTSSPVTGNWEEFMVQDLVSGIDTRYRTLPVAESRGIAGHSMGAYGAIKLAMKHPDVFSSVYAMSGAAVSINTMIEEWKDDFVAALQENSYPTWGAPHVRIAIAMAVALAPNPSLTPFMGEFPYDGEGTPVDSSWQKWLEHDPVQMLDEYADNMKQLEAIFLDCGTNDESMLSNYVFSNALDVKGVAHDFEGYSGDHVHEIPERLSTRVFPFFSEHLEHSAK